MIVETMVVKQKKKKNTFTYYTIIYIFYTLDFKNKIKKFYLT